VGNIDNWDFLQPGSAPQELKGTAFATNEFVKVAEMATKQENDLIFIATVISFHLKSSLIASIDAHYNQSQRKQRIVYVITSALLFFLGGFTACLLFWFLTERGTL
jgi:hypothetical protein